jgi:septal ring factor EnvC (AmiA/AmiB activator)
MQEKEIMTQPRTETAVLIEYVRRCASADRNCDNEPNKGLSEIADRLAEQEETIRKQRDAIKEFERYISEDAAEIATLRKTIGEQAATIERLRSKAELFDQLTRIE